MISRAVNWRRVPPQKIPQKIKAHATQAARAALATYMSLINTEDLFFLCPDLLVDSLTDAFDRSLGDSGLVMTTCTVMPMQRQGWSAVAGQGCWPAIAAAQYYLGRLIGAQRCYKQSSLLTRLCGYRIGVDMCGSTTSTTYRALLPKTTFKYACVISEPLSKTSFSVHMSFFDRGLTFMDLQRVECDDSQNQ